MLRGLRAAAAHAPRPRARRALTSSKERSKASTLGSSETDEHVALHGSTHWWRYTPHSIWEAAREPFNTDKAGDPMLNAMLGAAVVLFFGTGTYAITRQGWSAPPDPMDVRNDRYRGWRRKYTDEELEWLNDNRPTEDQVKAIMSARRERAAASKQQTD